jgi:hypothetical protein
LDGIRLTAEQYASELGINAKTLQFWKYKLAKPEPSARRATRRPSRNRTYSARKTRRQRSLPRFSAKSVRLWWSCFWMPQ